MLNVLIGVCLAYVIALFAVAFWAERASMQGRANWLRSPMIYTLSLSIYCTGWTFYGACLLYTSPSPRDLSTSRMPSSA